MRISSPWTLAAVQVLGLLGPRAAFGAPSAAGAKGTGPEDVVMERPRGREHQPEGQRGMMLVSSPRPLREVEHEHEHEHEHEQFLDESLPTDHASSSAFGSGIEALFSYTPYKIPLPPLFAESMARSSSPVSSNEGEDESKDEQQRGAEDATVAIPSRYYSTVLGRRLLALSSHGVLTTVFPANLSSSSSSSDPSAQGVPASVADTPIGLPEYIASCEEPSGNPTILSLKVSTSTRNAAAGSNVSLTLSWWDEYIHLTGQRPWALANLPRLSLTGYLEEISADQVSPKALETCFLRKHRDSVMWLPGRKWAAHQGFWTRLVVTQAYWIGGFGDKNYIGWFDPDEWRTVRKEDWEAVRLPGEKE
ncbi:uncharacterized protein PV07_06868 [Cladophialophora immunda]|uniref:CREG-like beta-barrel domain-containing protein n=1 Tax=Cladophialophora immunda TaxID=569365 RepID=A0A0D2APR7_9EURO|nr:uncharacterized protein PV07_06868 [Cladophialophora immunda]KIW27092.1 hypothetical protein PV07_06868 [Cladophialophora immunda]OQU99666.1 hypothetical protein CLAIMM_05270 [Cladophialophora immunda]